MRKLGLFQLLLFFLFCSFAQAAPKAIISNIPSWVKLRNYNDKTSPKSSEVYYGYYFNLYDEQVNVSENTYYVHSIKHITNETGISDNSQISIAFDGDFQQLYLHTLHVIRDGKIIDKLKSSSIKIMNQESDLNDLQYTGLYQAMIIMEDIRKDDRIELAYSIKGRNPIFRNKYSDNFSFVSMTPVMNYYVSLLTPSAKSYKYQLYNNAPSPKITQSGNYTHYDWDAMYLQGYDNSKDLSPSWFTDYPFLEFTEYKSWEDVATWCLDIIEHYKYTLPAELLKKMEDWDSSSHGDAMNFALKATRFIQDEIRYYGMEIGEYTHRPHSPTETYSKRFGDCKDKSILLATVLRQRGIKANIALVSTFYRDHLPEHLPSANRFNHVIVKAVIDHKTVWIDPTISQQHGNLISNYIPHYGKVLVVDEMKSSIENVAGVSSGTTDITETFTIPEKADAKAHLNVLTTFTHGDADYTRGKLNIGLQALQREYETYYAQQYDGVSLDGDITAEDDSGINSVSIRENYTLRNIWDTEDEKLRIDFFAKPIYDRLTDPAKADGKTPVALSYPMDIIYTQVFKMPSDWNLNLSDLEIKNDYYAFTFTPTLDGSVIRLTYTLTTFTDHIPASHVNNYKKEYKRINDALSFSITYDEKLAKNMQAVANAGWSGNLNWIMLFICLLTIGGINFLLFRINKKSGPYTSHEYLPPPIRSWLVLLAIGLCIRPFLYAGSIYQNEYLHTDVWMALNALGNTGLQLYFIIEMVSQVIFCMLSCWILYWFFMRRDIFPKMFVIMAVSELCVNIAFYTIVNSSGTIHDLYPGAEKNMLNTVVRSGIFVAIWVTSILRSQLAKDTFTRPYKYATTEA